MKKSNLVFSLALISLIGCRKEVPQKQLTQMEIQTLFTQKNLGLANLEEEQTQTALEAFEKVVELAPQEPLGYANIALVYLRLQKSEEARLWVQKALEVAPQDPDVHLISSEIYEWMNEEEQALKALERVIQLEPDNLIARYKKIRLYSMKKDDPRVPQVIEKELREIFSRIPENIAVLMELGQALMTNNKIEEAKEVYLKLLALSQDLNPETLQYLHSGLELLEKSQIQEAKNKMMIFENIQKNSPRYQQGRNEIAGNLLGIPIATFRRGVLQYAPTGGEPIPVTFQEITGEAGLEGIGGKGMAIGDVDGDSDPDLYLAPYLFRNEQGKFVKYGNPPQVYTPVATKGGILADYDNDGDLDLFTMNEGPNLLYKNDGKGNFQKIKETFGANGSSSLFFDFDHDGDLDLFLTQKEGENLLFENNVDAPFTEISKKVGIIGEKGKDCASVDFDDDGDLDIIVLYSNGLILYNNLRQGRFRKVLIAEVDGLETFDAGDVNNDGGLDLIVVGKKSHLYLNQGDGSFKKGNLLAISYQPSVISDVLFFDLDNDGYLDVFLMGENGVSLFRNDGKGEFMDVSLMLPGELHKMERGYASDFDQDGDLDLFLLGDEIHLLRNDGGNQNHWLDVKLVGLGVGAGKNNIQGLGARLEVKAGNLYQLKYVSDPISHFGLGRREEADVIRVVWTNGVSQDRVKPGVDLVFTEEQILKGSCPFLYAWNGEKFEFVTDLLWRSMLGMVTGNQTVGFHEAAEEYVKIPGSFLVPVVGAGFNPRESGDALTGKGEYLLRITQELWEIPYVDEVKLMVVDFPPEVLEVHVDERFLPPPFPSFEVYPVTEKIYPRKAYDEKGHNLLPLLLARDGKEVSEFERTRYQGITKLHDLILDFNSQISLTPFIKGGTEGGLTKGEKKGGFTVRLFLYGWLLPTDTSINIAIGKTRSYRPILPNLQVPNEKGEWVTVIDPLWFPAGRNKMMVVDLTDKFLAQDYRLRIQTTMEIHWDEAFLTVSAFSNQQSAFSIRTTTLSPLKANLQYHGFSKVVQSDGDPSTLGWPFALPEYNDASDLPLWRISEGNYTRYGDVTPVLQESDNQYVIMMTGDEISLSFPAGGVPVLQGGWKRDFVLFTNGWLKDSEINAIAGETVEPLPFHGMSKYPYGPDEHFPDDVIHQDYLSRYNTRYVTQEPFKNFVKNIEGR